MQSTGLTGSSLRLDASRHRRKAGAGSGRLLTHRRTTMFEITITFDLRPLLAFRRWARRKLGLERADPNELFTFVHKAVDNESSV